MAVYEEWRRRWPAVVVDCDTARAVELLRMYYETRDDGTPRYTGSRFEAIAALNPDPHAIGPADLVALATLGVAVGGEAVIRLLSPRNAADITELLEKIPLDRDIIDAPPEALKQGSAAGALWQLLRFDRDGVGRTKASKLLAAKRPRLLPIWDSRIEEATGLDTIDYWCKFQTVLTADNNSIWNWLCGLRSQVPEMPTAVSTLRLLDVILWMSVQKR